MFRQAIRAYLKSREFANLAPRTQKDYSASIYAADGIDAKFGSAPIGAFNRPEIRRIVYQWRDGFRSPRVADHRKTHLVKIVNWAVDHGYIAVNHLAGMSNLYDVDRSDLIWTNAEIAAFLETAPDYLRRIMVAATETGLRPQDLCVLSRGHIQKTPHGRRIYLRTQKRSRIISVPVTTTMGQIIDETPGTRLTILVGQKGAPYKKPLSMSRQVTRHKKAVNDAAIEKGLDPPIRDALHFYDCRGTAATRLFEAGATLREIATAMGWGITTAARMIETYVSMNPEASDSLLLKLQAAPLR